MELELGRPEADEEHPRVTRPRPQRHRRRKRRTRRGDARRGRRTAIGGRIAARATQTRTRGARQNIPRRTNHRELAAFHRRRTRHVLPRGRRVTG